MKRISKEKKSNGNLQSLAAVKRHLTSGEMEGLTDTIYLAANFQFVESEENTGREIDLVQQLTRMEPYDDVLDLCCGQGRHTIELCRRGFSSVVGVDPSRILVRMARKRFLEEGIKGGRFSQGDARGLRFSDERFDTALFLGNAIGAFDKESDEEKVFSELFRVLKERGSVVLEVVDGEWLKNNFQPKAYGWNDQKLFVCTERYLASDGKRMIAREVVVDPEKGQVAENFAAERLFSSDELKTLLVKHGFTEVYKHDFQKIPFSNRRDLMMVENRLFFTAAKPMKRKVFSRSGRLDRADPFPCQVFLGDPKFFDPLLKTTRMQHQAFESLKGFKEALKSLKQFDFSYFDNHRHFAKELLNKRPHFVFNVCHEGLFNEEEKELHVPALLDALSIPYSGSRPAAVALCFDRSHIRDVAKSADILVPDEAWLPALESSIALPKQFPALVKPALKRGGLASSIQVHTIGELRAAVETLKRKFPSTPLLVQEFLPGKEYFVGVFGNGEHKLSAFPLLERGEGGMILSSRLPKEEQRRVIHSAFALFRRVGASDWALFSFRKDVCGNIKLVSVKMNPSLFPEGVMAQMAQVAKLSYPEMLEKLLLIAVKRNQERLVPSHG